MVVRSGILRRLLPVAINRVETTINQDLKAMTPFHGGFSEWLLTCFSAWDKRIRDTYHKDGTTVDSIEFDSMLTDAPSRPASSRAMPHRRASRGAIQPPRLAAFIA